MNAGHYIAASGMATQRGRLDVLANNMANVETPGFTREGAAAPLDVQSAEAAQGFLEFLERQRHQGRDSDVGHLTGRRGLSEDDPGGGSKRGQSH